MSRAVTVACESPRSLNISTNATTGIIIAIAPKTSGASSLDNTTTEINCMQTRRACPALVERAPIVAWARIDPEALTMTFPSSDHLANPASYRSEEHTSELQSLMRISYAVFCLKKKTIIPNTNITPQYTQAMYQI